MKVRKFKKLLIKAHKGSHYANDNNFIDNVIKFLDEEKFLKKLDTKSKSTKMSSFPKFKTIKH